MNAKKRMVTLSVILVVLVLVYILGTIFSPEKIGERGANQVLFEGVSSDAAAAILLKGAGESIKLEREKDGKWIILIEGEPFPATAKKVDDMTEAVLGLRQNRIVSTSDSSWSRFNLDDSAPGIFIEDINGGKIVSLLIGSQGVRGEGDYFRLDGEKNVFLSDIPLAFFLDKSADYWSDLDLYPGNEISADSVSLVSVNADIVFDAAEVESIAAHYTLIKTADKDGELWSEQNSEHPLDQQLVQNLVRSLANLKGDGFVALPEERGTGFANQQEGIKHSEDVAGEIQFTTVEGKSFTLRIGNNAGNDGFYLSSSSSPYIYTISPRSLKRVLKGVEDLYQKAE